MSDFDPAWGNHRNTIVMPQRRISHAKDMRTVVKHLIPLSYFCYNMWWDNTKYIADELPSLFRKVR